MTKNHLIDEYPEPERYELYEEPPYRFDFSRRGFVQILGAGLLVSVTGGIPLTREALAEAQRRSALLSERLHIGTDGVVTVMTSKVEVGQGSRTELTQAAAEELRVPLERLRLIMADTDLTPDDGGTFGSRTTPRTVPVIRSACSAAREFLIGMAADKWQTNRSLLTARDGKIIHQHANQEITYSELAKTEDFSKTIDTARESGAVITSVHEWRIMGEPVHRVGGADIVTGSHRFPSDIARPGMFYGKVLQPPSYGATLVSIDMGPAQELEGVITVRDGNFIGVAAPTSNLAEKALNAIAKTAQWETQPHPSSRELFPYLKEHASSGGGSRRRGGQNTGSIQIGLQEAAKVINESYEIAYIQHAPMEPRAAVAEWNDGKATVWTGTQRPDGVRSEIVRAFRVTSNNVRVIVPDTGGGFGGKHTGETAVQAARLARSAGKPVSLRWTREEEFTWAYFRPAGLIEIRAGLDEVGSITAWEYTNYNSGTAALSSPYSIPNITSQFRGSDSPLREGSYRALAATANNFARESFMDELAFSAKIEPLEFRLKHLKNDRLSAVLVHAAKQFDWVNRKKERSQNRGAGLACGTEKGGYTAACVDVEVNRKTGEITVREIFQVFECGAIINPENLRSQVEGCIVMGLGGALWEEIKFENGKILNGHFRTYRVPRFNDVPRIEIFLLNRPDLPSAGAGECPIIAVAPAIANAVFAASGVRIRSLPIKSDALKQG